MPTPAEVMDDEMAELIAENERLHRLLCSLIWLPKVREAIAELPEDDRLRVFAETV